MAKTVKLPGTTLEGGGQLLRLAIGLSALTQTPVEITDIRGNRRGGGGLKRQHLTSVHWLRSACQAHTEGAGLKSRRLLFEPNQILENTSYRIRQDTPGSIALVLQAVLPFLLYSGPSGAIELTITGGTNVSGSPSVDYLQKVLVPMLELIGVPRIDIACQNRGWATGHASIGSVSFKITPLRKTLPNFDLSIRGDVKQIDAVIIAPRACQALFEDILRINLETAFPDIDVGQIEYEDSRNDKRFYLLLTATTENGMKLGRDWLYDRKVNPDDNRQIMAEMARKMTRELRLEVSHGGCVDEYMRDQLVVFQALADGYSRIDGGQTKRGDPMAPSLHAQTAMWVAEQILGVEFGKDGGCTGVAFSRTRTTDEPDDLVKGLEVLELSSAGGRNE